MTASGKKRIPFINFMKGMCIILVMGTHISSHFFSPHVNDMLQAFRIPLYYFLSGLFFKTYDGFWDFTRRKFNNIIVPFVFFFLLAFIVYACRCEVLQMMHGEDLWTWNDFSDQLLDPFFERSYRLNVPLWFLLSLFEINLLFFGMKKLFTKRWALGFTIFVLSLAGWFLAHNRIAFPLVADTALIGLPFFFLGNTFKEKGFLAPSKYDKYGWLTLPPLILFLYYFASPLNIRDQILPPYILLYSTTILSISCLFWACKNMPKVPVINYIGRYSIVVLGTHCILLFFAQTIISEFMGAPWRHHIYLVFVALFVMELAIIPFIVRFFPRFTAQKELIKPRK